MAADMAESIIAEVNYDNFTENNLKYRALSQKSE